jgi:hypothetical protein
MRCHVRFHSQVDAWIMLRHVCFGPEADVGRLTLSRTSLQFVDLDRAARSSWAGTSRHEARSREANRTPKPVLEGACLAALIPRGKHGADVLSPSR